MAKKTVVGPAAVRAFAVEKGIEGRFAAEKARGRLPKSLIEQFEKETGQKVETGFKPAKTVTLSVTKIDAKGRKRTRKVEVPLSEVRAEAQALGVAGERGVLSAKAIMAVAEARSDKPAVEAPESPASE